jgi:hypothetical protein
MGLAKTTVARIVEETAGGFWHAEPNYVVGKLMRALNAI